MTIADARRALESLAAEYVTDPEALRLLMQRADEYAPAQLADQITDIIERLEGMNSSQSYSEARYLLSDLLPAGDPELDGAKAQP